jgi:hypothetical protein
MLESKIIRTVLPLRGLDLMPCHKEPGKANNMNNIMIALKVTDSTLLLKD